MLHYVAQATKQCNQSPEMKKRKSNTQQERNKDKKALAKYRHLEVTLDDEQNDD